MTDPTRTVPAIVMLVLALVAVGCSSAPKAETGPPGAVFYPPPPDQPRLQFLTSFSDAEFLVQKKSSFAEFVVGTPDQEAIGKIHGPYGLAANRGKVYICDIAKHRVHIFDFVGRSYAQLGTPEQILGPVNITLDADGTKYVCDTQKARVVVYDAQDRFVRYLGDPDRCTPIDLAIQGEELYVVNISRSTIEVWSKTTGELLRYFSSKGMEPDQLRMPTNLDIGPDGNLYVTDTELCTVKVFSPEGKLLRLIGEPGDRPGYFARPKGIAIDPQGNMYVADAQWEVIQIFTTQGKTLLYFGGADAGPQGMGMPAGLFVDDTSLDAFRSYLAPGFEPKYLLFVANQFGVNKIGVYAFGTMKP